MSIFSVSSNAGDVETLMGAVADALQRWEGGEARSLDLVMVQDQGERLAEQARRLALQWNIDGNAVIHSTRPGLGPWVIRFQMTVRRLTWWFLEPILQQIRLFQMNSARTVDGLAQNQEVLAARYAELQDLAHRVQVLEEQVKGLQSLPGANERRDVA